MDALIQQMEDAATGAQFQPGGVQHRVQRVLPPHLYPSHAVNRDQYWRAGCGGVDDPRQIREMRWTIAEHVDANDAVIGGAGAMSVPSAAAICWA